MAGVEQERNAALDEQIRDRPAIAAKYHMIEHGRIDRRVVKKCQGSVYVRGWAQNARARGRESIAKVQANDGIVLNNENANALER